MEKKYEFTIPKDQLIRSTIADIEKAFEIDREELLNTIDAQPVRHGRWLGVGEQFSEDWECSVCGKPKGGATSSKYCSSCGTKMDIIFQDDKVTAIKVVGWDGSDV